MITDSQLSGTSKVKGTALARTVVRLHDYAYANLTLTRLPSHATRHRLREKQREFSRYYTIFADIPRYGILCALIDNLQIYTENTSGTMRYSHLTNYPHLGSMSMSWHLCMLAHLPLYLPTCTRYGPSSSRPTEGLDPRGSVSEAISYGTVGIHGLCIALLGSPASYPYTTAIPSPKWGLRVQSSVGSLHT